MAVDAKPNEITAIRTLLGGLLLEGWVVTTGALLTQQKIAQAIVEAEGDYILVVKNNQPTLHADIAAATCDRNHGRVERRELTLTDALHGYLTRPSQQQAFRVVRTRTSMRTGEVSGETVYGSTSLPPARRRRLRP